MVRQVTKLSGSLKKMILTKWGISLICFIAAGACLFAAILWMQNIWGASHPQFRDTRASGICSPAGKHCWQVYGGSWERADGVMMNSSDDRGAKIMTGDTAWRDYVVEADLQLLGESGDAGFVARSTNEDIGVDAYDGYFAGIRSTDDTLILGRSDYGWQRLRKVPTKTPLQSNTWYHLKLMVYQCWLFATFTDDHGQATATSFRDEHCYPNGRFGLKSYYVPAAWRNVIVYPAAQTDFEAALKSIPSLDSASLPDPQDSFDALNDTRLLAPMQRASRARMSSADAMPIAQLMLLDPNVEQRTVIRGVVTMLHPQLFVQDSTGAVSVEDYRSDLPFQTGNAVEVTGLVHRGDYSASLREAKVRTMWSHATVLPVPVSATQAASGAYDKQLIQLEGTLEDLHREDGNRYALRLRDGQQEFVAYAHDNGLTKTIQNLQRGSRLRLSGVCMIDTTLVKGDAAFALLMRSFEDVTLVQPPPWWDWTHIIELILAAIVMTFAIQYAFYAIQRIRMRATIDERQRLAMEMHDSLAQSFAGIGFRLEALSASAEVGSPLRAQLTSTVELVRYGHKEARRNIAAISPGNLESLGLLASLQHAARGIIQDGTITVETKISGQQKQVPLQIEDTLLRIGQEAIANAVRHAKPSMILLSLTFGEKFVKLSVRDDGVGFHYNADHAGYGITGMRERARSIRASLRVGSSPGRGTVVVVRAGLPNAIFRKLSWQGLRLLSWWPRLSRGPK